MTKQRKIKLIFDMKSIFIKGSHESYFIPTVNFSAETGICELSGESYLEETIKFYTPLFNWIKEYSLNTENSIQFNFKLTYFNTSSSKCIVDILNMLKKFQDAGGNVSVYWHYDDNDEDVEEELEEVEDFMDETGLTINLVPIKK